MTHSVFQKALYLVLAVLVLWLGGGYLLPLAMPFLLGFLLALAAEPLVGLLSGKPGLSRSLSAFLGVTVTLLLLLCLGVLLVAFLLRELGNLAGVLPDLEAAATQGLGALEIWLLDLAGALPQGLRNLGQRLVLGLFDGGSALYAQLAGTLPGLATAVLSHIPDGFLTLGTALLSAYLFSGRMDRMLYRAKEKLPRGWKERWLPALRGMRATLAGWLRAQLKLLVITYVIVTAGLWLLGVAYGPIWAAAIALVDAVPLLGTGIVLVPWSLVSFLQGDTLRAFGMLALYAVSALSRSALEPRLLGKQLGLDPLVTLVALYLGYQLFGLGGMLLAPMLAVTVAQLYAGQTND